MTNKNNPSQYFGQDFAKEFWKGMKDISWNASSTKYLSQNRMNFQSIDHNDIKMYNNESVVNILNSLYEISVKNSNVFLGPTHINMWIVDNKVLLLSSKSLLLLFKKHINVSPQNFFNMWIVIEKFLNYCSKKLNISVVEINDEHLNQESLFISFIENTLYCKKELTIVDKFYRFLFNRENEIFSAKLEPLKKETITLDHPLANIHLENLLKEGLSKYSLNKRKNHYKEFITWLTRTYSIFHNYLINDIPLNLVDTEHLIEYQDYLINKHKLDGANLRTLSDAFYNIRSLFSYLSQKRLIRRDITQNVSGIPFNRYKYRVLPTDEQLNVFFEIVEIYAPQPRQYKVAYYFMLYLGLRKGEVSKLKWSDINLNTNTISIKGEKNRYYVLPLPKKIKDELLAFEHKKPNINSGIFCGHDRIYQDLYNFYKIFSFIADWNLPGGVHLFRHTFLSRISKRDDCPPQVLSSIARHVRPETTSLYIHRDNAVLINSINSINY